MQSGYLKLCAWALLIELVFFAGTIDLPSKEAFVDIFAFLTNDKAILASIASLLVAAICGASFLVAYFYWKKLAAFFDKAGQEQATYLDTLDASKVSLAIVLAAAASLFFELIMIRWQASLVPLFAFYKNFSLLACFAGLGLGYGLARQKHIPLLLGLVMLAALVAGLSLLRMGIDTRSQLMTTVPVVEQQSMGLISIPSYYFLVGFIPYYIFIGIVFTITALAFIPVGQVCGRLMQRKPDLIAYGLNLLGSIIGIVLIFIISYLWSPPVIWFSLLLGILLWFQRANLRLHYAGVVVSIVVLIAAAWPVWPTAQAIYSPYQLILRASNKLSGLTMLEAGGLYYQHIYDLAFSNSNRQTDKHTRLARDYYELPYRFQTGPGRVAIVGSGTGNDVAAALRMTQAHIDAIEIDPVIIALGKKYHPEYPYADTRVTIINNDARTFFRTTRETYDAIVYGMLDSHTLLSHASSVRLDSFVYTQEGLQEAYTHLATGGIISLSFSMLSPELGRKIYMMMENVFDASPTVIQAGYDDSIVFIATKGKPTPRPTAWLKASGFSDASAQYGDPSIRTDIPTDDWPFFYMAERVYPFSYIPMLGLVLLLTWLISRELFEREAQWRANLLPFFFLGAGFMLVQTKSITQLGLLFGNTWQTIGITIIGLLLMAYLANAFVAQRRATLGTTVPAMLLLVTLLAGYVVAVQGGFSATIWGYRLWTIILVSLPMFFSGILFSSLLRRHQDISSVMFANILGAMLGGILEYNSMYFGFAFLYLLAIALYALAIFFSYQKTK